MGDSIAASSVDGSTRSSSDPSLVGWTTDTVWIALAAVSCASACDSVRRATIVNAPARPSASAAMPSIRKNFVPDAGGVG